MTWASFATMIETLAVNLEVSTWETRAGRRLGSEVVDVVVHVEPAASHGDPQRCR